MRDEKGDTLQVLVVDDEPDLEPLIQMRMRQEIRSGEYRFHFASSGLDALEKLDLGMTVDMVITDINMPHMDGLTLLQKIRERDPDMKSIVVSAYGDMRNIRIAMNRGAFDFVTKPVDFEDLRTTIERARVQMREWKQALTYRDQLVAIQSELETAYNMQQAILPPNMPVTPAYDADGIMEPAWNVGGDFYDLMALGGNRVGIAVADVSGKGIPAAMFMMSSRTLLKGAAIGLESPGRVLEEVNRMLCEDNRATMFVTVLYGVYDPGTGELAYANGGHCNPLVIGQSGGCRELPATGGVALGLADGLPYAQEWTTIQPGETLLMFTDGVTEAVNPEGEEFGTDRLVHALEGRSYENAGQVNAAVNRAVREFAGETDQSDDITSLAFHRRNA